jgi:uncharacterized protein YndB with AHSA1/START domain
VTVTHVRRDVDALSLTFVAEYDAPPARVWELWADPRQLERWWGPPTYPATVVEHDLVAGASVSYYMTGPEGDRHWGWWRIVSVEPPTSLAFEDGFADETGAPDPSMPVTLARVRIEAREGGGTRMVLVSTFPSRETMDQVLAMGAEEGMRLALGQTDAILAAAEG